MYMNTRAYMRIRFPSTSLYMTRLWSNGGPGIKCQLFCIYIGLGPPTLSTGTCDTRGLYRYSSDAQIATHKAADPQLLCHMYRPTDQTQLEVGPVSVSEALKITYVGLCEGKRRPYIETLFEYLHVYICLSVFKL